MLGHVVAGSPGPLGHDLLLHALRQALGERDVPSLAALVAVGEQDEEGTTTGPSHALTNEVHAVPGAAVDAQLDAAAAHGGAVAGVPGGKAFDAGEDARSSRRSRTPSIQAAKGSALRTSTMRQL